MKDFIKVTAFLLVVTVLSVPLAFTQKAHAAWGTFECDVLEAGYRISDGKYYVRLLYGGQFTFEKTFPAGMENQFLAVALSAATAGTQVKATMSDSFPFRFQGEVVAMCLIAP